MSSGIIFFVLYLTYICTFLELRCLQRRLGCGAKHGAAAVVKRQLVGGMQGRSSFSGKVCANYCPPVDRQIADAHGEAASLFYFCQNQNVQKMVSFLMSKIF